MEQQSTIDLQTRLNKSVVAFRLRDILIQHGIPQEETVKISIEDSRGQVLVSSEIPPSKGKVMVNQASSLREDVVDFLNRADAMFELLSKLPKANASVQDNPEKVMYQITFDCGKMESIMQNGEKVTAEMKASPLTTISVRGYKYSPCPVPPFADCCYL